MGLDSSLQDFGALAGYLPSNKLKHNQRTGAIDKCSSVLRRSDAGDECAVIEGDTSIDGTADTVGENHVDERPISELRCAGLDKPAVPGDPANRLLIVPLAPAIGAIETAEEVL